jgi:tetratricopeptide (TPR) repeat protein
VRQAIIAEALKYTEQLASESQGDAVLQLELARAYIRIGRVQGLPGQANLGDREGALASFRRAQALTEPLLRMPDPDGAIAGTYVEAARRVSETLQAIGGRRDEAIAEARKAVAAAERHLGPQPGDLAARSLIASASFTAALVTDWPDSLSHWQRAEGLYEALLAEQPGDEPTQRNVALVAKYLGSFYERSRDFATARRHYQRALALDEARLVRMPSDRLAQLDVAIDLGNVALTEWRDGNLDVAERRYAESLKIRKRLADSDPTDANARTRVAYVHVQLAELGVAAGRFAKAAGHANVAIDTYGPNPADATSRFEAARATWTLGKAQRGLGRTAAACAALESAVRAMRAVDERVRRARYLEGRDPLDDLVPETARCGTKGTETPSGRASARPPS